MHQRSSNKKCVTIIESTELRRTHTANRSTILFNVRGCRAFSHVERFSLPHADVNKNTLSGSLLSETRFKTWGKNLVS